MRPQSPPAQQFFCPVSCEEGIPAHGTNVALSHCDVATRRCRQRRHMTTGQTQTLKRADPPGAAPTQRIVRVRREYNTWVADETLEDYALRFAPRSFRKWSAGRVAATAFGSVSFLALEAI